MYYELDDAGLFIADIPFGNPEEFANWTAVPPPQPVYTPVFIGTRNRSTGEWLGHWEDLGPKPEVTPFGGEA